MTVIAFILGLLPSAFGLKCLDVSGLWQNELGSRMLLDVDKSNRISGQYWTAVERKPGAAAFTSNVSGIFSSRKEGSLLAFSVIFNHGSSLSIWVGQCLVCGDKEILYTTYILKKHVSEPKEKWTANIMNQNTFQRSQREVEDVISKASSVKSKPVVSQTPSAGFPVHGKWRSHADEEIEIFQVKQNFSKGLPITGKWKTKTNEGTEIYGMSDTLEDKSYVPGSLPQKDGSNSAAVTFGAISNNRIRYFAGHASESSSGSSKILETTWLEHEFSSSCTSPRRVVQFGMENFTRILSDGEYPLKKSETFMEKIRKFFGSMF